MKKTFQSEDARKDQLFKAWNEFLLDPKDLPEPESFVEFYEGLALVSNLSDEHISFRLDDGTQVKHLAISPEIRDQSRPGDCLYVILGRQNETWWPLDVISVGSHITGRRGGFHLSINPLVLECDRLSDIDDDDFTEMVH